MAFQYLEHVLYSNSYLLLPIHYAHCYTEFRFIILELVNVFILYLVDRSIPVYFCCSQWVCIMYFPFRAPRRARLFVLQSISPSGDVRHVAPVCSFFSSFLRRATFVTVFVAVQFCAPLDSPFGGSSHYLREIRPLFVRVLYEHWEHQINSLICSILYTCGTDSALTWNYSACQTDEPMENTRVRARTVLCQGLSVLRVTIYSY